MNVKTLDLTKTYPRSCKEKMGGYTHLARMSDKARAKAAGALGEYIYPCPLDQSLLEFLGIGPHVFYKAAQEKDDQGMVAWLKENTQAHSLEDIERWNQAFLSRGPTGGKSMDHFLKVRDQVAPHRTDIMTWVDLLDLEEGREVPPRMAA